MTANSTNNNYTDGLDKIVGAAFDKALLDAVRDGRIEAQQGI